MWERGSGCAALYRVTACTLRQYSPDCIPNDFSAERPIFGARFTGERNARPTRIFNPDARSQCARPAPHERWRTRAPPESQPVVPENSAEAVRCASLTGKCKTYPNALRPGRAPRQKRKLPGATMAWHRRNHVSLIQVESRRDRRVANWRLSGQLHIFEARHKFDHFAQGPILNQGNLKERT